MHSGAVTTYSLDLRPYIEEPTPRVVPSSHVSVNHCPKFRHDFVLSKQESVDAYWETLKYCYLTAALADQNAFPGNCVPEVCHQCYTPLYFIYLYLVIKEGALLGDDLLRLHICRFVMFATYENHSLMSIYR